MSIPRTRNPHEDAVFSNVKRVARHSAVYGFLNFLARATGLILIPLYTRTWTKQEVGGFEIFTVTQPFIQAVLLMGFNSALVRYYSLAESAQEKEAYYRTAFTAVVAFSAAVLLPLVLFVPNLISFLQTAAVTTFRLNPNDPGLTSSPSLWRILFFVVLLDTVIQMFLALFRARAKPFQFAAINITQFALILIINVFVVGVLKKGVAGAMTGFLIANLVAALVAFIMTLRDTRMSFSKPLFDRLASFGFPLVLSSLAFSILNSSDRFFLKLVSGEGTVAIYGLGYKVGLVMAILMNAFVAAWPPIMYRIYREEANAKAIYARVLTYYTFASGLVFLLIASFSHKIVQALAPPDYAPAAGFIWIILLAYLLQGVYYVFTVGVTVTDKAKWIAIVVVSGAVLNLGLNVLLIPRFGMFGAAWATLASFAALAFGMLLAAQRLYPIPWEAKRLLQLAVPSGIALWINLHLIGHRTLGDALLKVFVLAALLLVLFFTGFFTPEEKLRAQLLVQRVLKRKSIKLP